MNKDIDWELLARYLSGECDSTGKVTVENWIHSSQENRQTYEQLNKYWNTNISANNPSDLNSLWSEISGQISSENRGAEVINIESDSVKRRQKSGAWIQYAAAVILIILLPALFVYKQNVKNNQLITHIVELGSIDTLILADNTQIILDAGSKIEYPAKFSRDGRFVNFEGEAFFKVKSDKKRPFQVVSNNANVEVLGTEFNLRSFKSESKTSLEVIEGKVRLSNENKSQSLILLAGNKSFVDKQNNVSEKESFDIAKSIAWLDGQKEFKDSRLSDILNQAERWYGIDINFEDKSILNEKFDFHLKRDNSDGFYKLLAVVSGTEYKIEGKKVTYFTIPE